jgi:hypothetical protein
MKKIVINTPFRVGGKGFDEGTADVPDEIAELAIESGWGELVPEKKSRKK